MDRGLSVANPYASVSIPRTHLQDGFLKYYLGEDLTPDTVLFNPSTLPTYSAAQEASQQVAYGGWNTPKIQTQESWARPYNPYASLKMPSEGSSEPFHWKSLEAPPTRDTGTEGGGSGCCCSCWQICCPGCKRCCCVVS